MTLKYGSLLLLAALAAPAHARDAAVVATDRGQVRGAIADGIASWKGIPFAAPATGALRWRAPQPAAAWRGVRNARAYGPDCAQVPFPSDAAPLGTTPAEDCFYANVWKPAGAGARRLPVIVWIYGGGFVNGGASPPTYAGANLARQGVMVVSFNYRLGRLGTFALPQLTRADADHGLIANYLTMDQIAALRWVRRNAAAFGGDPGNVTIVGESAGGMSVHTLVTAPLARGLFRKAVVMSGGDAQAMPVRLSDVEAMGADFARGKGIDPAAPDALARLRALPADRIVDGLNLATLAAALTPRPTITRPFPDGKVVVDSGAAYAAGRFVRVPMLIGATSADIGGVTGPMIAGARSAAATISRAGAPVWAYRFSYVPESVRAPGAYHATDIPFFFDNQAIKYGAATTARDQAMGRTISAYLVNFAKRGDPNGPGLPAWPRYAAATDQLMDFTPAATARAGRDPWGPQIDAAATTVR
ncbi:carboxylesterase/lipase family protein [Sphingomonas ginsenosidimutans]|uniref:carboxylesterase/lipase family protein n=2 Tax=Sphingomonas TaxID=13687 RepID=UPI0008777642|nr:carboxylesterase family protein [Sphingomonas ginsenosidimutans]MBY0303133.1 carboxylesterase family protein [Sphingomonas ginsenosidimutans]